MKIHPTALVSPEARLGNNVEVGAFAIIEDHVKIGDDCIIQAHTILTDRVTLGSGNLVGYGSVIGSAPQDHAHNADIVSEVIIGNNNTFREHVTIHRGTKSDSATVVGNDNLMMAGAHLGHNVRIGDRNIVANNCLFAGYVQVEDDVVLGGGSVFHQFIRVGRMCMVQGNSGWSKDLPPYVMGANINVVHGINAVGMRRKGVSAAGRADIKRAYKLLYRSGLNVSQAVERAAREEWLPEAALFFEFVRTRSKRGISPAHSAADEI